MTPASGSALLIFLTVTADLPAWCTLNWFALAITGREVWIPSARSLPQSIPSRTRAGLVFAAGDVVWFNNFTAFVLATSIAGFPLAFAPYLPPVAVLGGVLVVAVLYFAVADFLYVGRLAAYMAMLEMPESQVSAQTAPPALPLDPNLQPSPAVDATELILSDVPAPS